MFKCGLPVLLLLAAGCAGVSAHLERAEKLEDEQLYPEALEELKAAEKMEPDNPEPKVRIQRLRSKMATQAANDGAALLEMKDGWGALENLRRALELDSESSEARQNLKRAVDMLVGEVVTLRKDKKMPEAFKQAERLSKALPRHTDVRRVLEETRLEWAKQLLAEARDLMGRKLVGNALLRLVKISNLVGAWGDSPELERQARSTMAAEARFCVRLDGAKTKPALRARQETLLEAISGQKLEKCTCWDGFSRSCRKVTVQISLSAASLSDSRQPDTGEHKYQSGKRKVDNPKHVELKGKIEENRSRLKELANLIKDDEKVLDECRQAFADAGPDDDEESLRGRLKKAEDTLAGHKNERKKTEDDIISMRDQLSHLPAKLDEPVFDVFRFEVTKLTRTASVSFNLTATGEGRQRLREESIEGSASASDTTNPAYKRYGVEADGLRLPKTDEQLLQEAIGVAASKAGQLLADLCQSWRNEVLSRARQAAEDAPLEATEDFVLYLFADSAPPPKDVVDFLSRQHDVTDIGAVRGEASSAPAETPSQEPPLLEPPPAEEESPGLEI